MIQHILLKCFTEYKIFYFYDFHLGIRFKMACADRIVMMSHENPLPEYKI